SRPNNTLVSNVLGNTFFDPTNTILTAPERSTHIVFDTRILFDRNSGRWFALAARSLRNDGVHLTGNDVILAVSRTFDPTGLWDQYNLPIGENSAIIDYPTLGVDKNGVYIGVSMLAGTPNLKSKLIATPLAPLLNPTQNFVPTLYQADVTTNHDAWV